MIFMVTRIQIVLMSPPIFSWSRITSCKYVLLCVMKCQCWEKLPLMCAWQWGLVRRIVNTLLLILMPNHNILSERMIIGNSYWTMHSCLWPDSWEAWTQTMTLTLRPETRVTETLLPASFSSQKYWSCNNQALVIAYLKVAGGRFSGDTGAVSAMEIYLGNIEIWDPQAQNNTQAASTQDKECQIIKLSCRSLWEAS